jgi:hypothetical protein
VSRYRETILGVLETTRIVSGDAYDWCHGRYERPDVEGGTAEGWLTEALTNRLYSQFFCSGRPVGSRGSGRPWPRASGFVEELSAANTGTGCWEPGWRIVGAENGTTIVERDGLRLWARADEMAPEGGMAAVRLPKELRRLSAGFYLALGNRALDGRPGRLVRLYWNLRPESAPAFLECVTSLLNDADLAFRVKLLDTPALYARRDAGVLYVNADDRARAAAPVAAIYARHADVLDPGVPAFTKALAPGLAAADDPGGDESFGKHRCRLLAQGMVRAHERGREDASARLEVVAEVFAEAGIRLDRPYLNPGSPDDDAFERALQPTVR